MNTVGFVFKNFISGLRSGYDSDEARTVAAMVFDHTLGMSRVEITAKSRAAVSETDMARLDSMLSDLQTGKPVQYIIGYTWFQGMKISVNQHVLIPRRETEELVDWIIRDVKFLPKTIVDYCTGSGCIAIALKKAFPTARVIGVDVSGNALSVASGNAKQYSMNIEWLNGDLLNDDLALEADLVVSNPPYVRESESSVMTDRVKKFEPYRALFVPDNNPLVFFKRISASVMKHSPVGSVIYYEINEAMGREISVLHSQMGFTDFTLQQDLQEKDRFFKAFLPAHSL